MRSPLPGSVLLGVGLWCAGCGQRQVEIIGGLPDGAGAPAPCPATLAARLEVRSVPVDRDIAWQKLGYDHFPFDERAALAVQPDGQAQIAWLEVNPDTAAGRPQPAPVGVHVTPLDASLARRGPDAIVSTGQEVSGLVAHERVGISSALSAPLHRIRVSDRPDYSTSPMPGGKTSVFPWLAPLSAGPSPGPPDVDGGLPVRTRRVGVEAV